MNKQERKAIREKHTARITDYKPYCYACETDMPCDVIRVLDAWENQVEGCPHAEVSADFDGVPGLEPYESRYCPDCGELINDWPF